MIDYNKKLRKIQLMAFLFFHRYNATAHRKKAYADYLTTTRLKLSQKITMKEKRCSSDDELQRAWDNESAIRLDFRFFHLDNASAHHA